MSPGLTQNRQTGALSISFAKDRIFDKCLNSRRGFFHAAHRFGAGENGRRSGRAFRLAQAPAAESSQCAQMSAGIVRDDSG